MITLESKAHFVANHSKDDLAWLVNQLSHPSVRTAMVFSLSLMAEQGASAERLAGAKQFRDILINLGEPPDTKPTFPERKLTLG